MKQRQRPSLVQRQLTEVSAAYDIDGDGVLNETEQAMRDLDTENRGYLTNQQIYDIVQDEIRSKKIVRHLKKLASGLICFVVLIAISNMGTSLAAALLAKDVKADNSVSVSGMMSSLIPGGDTEPEDNGVPAMRIASTDEIVGAQTTAETYTATEMSDEDLDERRSLVVAEIDEDPHSHSHRRQLQIQCRAVREECMDMSGFITFDTHSISTDEFTNIENKCKQQRNVNIKRRWGDESRNIPVCGRGTRVVVKKKKKKKRNKKNKNKDKDKDEDRGDIMDNGPCKGGECSTVGKSNSRNMVQRGYVDKDVIIERDDGSIMHADCQGNLCFIGGTMFRGQIGDSCRIKADECSADTVCKQSHKKSRNKKFGTCVRATSKDVLMTRGGNELGARCVASDGRDACDSNFFCLPNDFRVFDFKKSNRKLFEYKGLGTCTRTVALGQTCYADYDCGGGKYCDGLRPGKYGVCARLTTAVGTIAKRARKNQDCKISFGSDACIMGFGCYPTRGYNTKIVARKSNVGICQRVKKLGRRTEVCSIDYGYDACEVGYHCLSANGREIRAGIYGVCTTSSVAVIVRNARRDGICRIDFGLNACKYGFGCYLPARDGRVEARRVSVGICDVVSRSASPDTVCDVSLGNTACVSGYECRAPNSAVRDQYGICTRSASVVSGRGRWYVNYDLGTQGGCINDGNANRWENTWATANECCKQHLWWMTKSQCVWDANVGQITRDAGSNGCLPAGASFADDCTNSQQCSGRRTCLKNCTPGSDRWFCY